MRGKATGKSEGAKRDGKKIEETFLTVIAIRSIFCTLCHSFFMAIGDLYGVISWKQSVTDIKVAIWHTCSKHSFIIYMIGRVSITGTRYPPIAYRQSAINTSLAHKSTPKSCPNPTLTIALTLTLNEESSSKKAEIRSPDY